VQSDVVYPTQPISNPLKAKRGSNSARLQSISDANPEMLDANLEEFNGSKDASRVGQV